MRIATRTFHCIFLWGRPWLVSPIGSAERYRKRCVTALLPELDDRFSELLLLVLNLGPLSLRRACRIYFLND